MPNTTYVAGRTLDVGFGEANTGADADVQHFEPGETVHDADQLTGLKGLVANAYLIPTDEYADYEAADSPADFAKALAADIPEEAGP